MEKQDKDMFPTGKFMFNLSLADLLRLTMFGAIIVLTQDITRLPVRLPGHITILWMGILVLGKGLIPKFGSGITMGIVSGTLAVLFGLSKEGVFGFGKYLAPALLIDLIAPLFNNKMNRPLAGIISGALTSLAQMAVNFALGMLLNIPLVSLTTGLWFSTVSHALFGAIGGYVATQLINRLKPLLLN